MGSVGTRSDQGSLIRFVCTAEVHAQPGVAAVTIHKGLWAFCAFDVLAAGHRWEETEGISLWAARTSGQRITIPLIAPGGTARTP